MPNSLSSLVLVVAFLALTAIAMVLHAENTKQGNMTNDSNLLLPKISYALSNTWSFVLPLLDFGVKKYDTGTVEYSEDPSFSMSDKIKGEWAKSDAAGAGTNSGLELDNDFSDFLEWQRTETGALILLRPGEGKEYVLPLPFSFLKAKP
jgi:hypothetical protein